MEYILYFIISIFATTLGALTGMGGGVIIKPVLDMLGHYDVASISMLSSITVFVMSAVSLFRQRNNPEKPKSLIAVPLAIGAVVGGNIGSSMLDAIINGSNNSINVTVIQNIILASLIIVVFVYMLYKEKLRSPKLNGIMPSALVGLSLGLVSSFLGIGGGPINVALIIFLFAFPSKMAALCSLLTILFSQSSKLVMALITGGFGKVDLTMLPVMLIGAVMGGFIGGAMHKRINDKTADILFNAAQIVVFAICVVNIIRGL